MILLNMVLLAVPYLSNYFCILMQGSGGVLNWDALPDHANKVLVAVKQGFPYLASSVNVY